MACGTVTAGFGRGWLPRDMMILNAIPTSVDFIPMDLLEQGMDMMDAKPEMAAKGGIMNINDITRPVGV